MATAGGVSTETEAAEEQAYRFRHLRYIRRDLFLWRFEPDGCIECGERIGHWGGSAERPECLRIPLNVPLEEVRPNCFAVRRHWIGDAIRAAEQSAPRYLSPQKRPL